MSFNPFKVLLITGTTALVTGIATTCVVKNGQKIKEGLCDTGNKIKTKFKKKNK